MKTNLKNKGFRRILLALACAVLTMGSVWADNDAPVMKIINAGMGKQFALQVEGLAARAQFQIMTASGTVLVSENIKQPSYEGLYNLQALEAGEYTLVLKTELREIEQPIYVTDRLVYFDANERKEWTLPVLQLTGRNLDFSFLNQAQGPVKLTLYSEDGTQLHEETIEQALTIEKRFDLTRAPRGEYTMRIQANHRTWYRTVTY
ncbi:MAG: hypothetical protein KDC54_13015 [Lewinella sp.]|nr:hypothetical protein [Lewinella sp.]